MKIKQTRLDLIVIGYFITSTILLLDCTDNFPGISLLRKVKYIFLILLVLDFVFSRKKLAFKSSLFIIGFLGLHTILFGLIWVNPMVQEMTKIHFREMTVYLFFLGFLTNAVERYNCRLKFIETTSVAFAVFMIWCGLTHFSEFVNPLYFVLVFSRTARIRSKFGTGSPNYMGYYCFIALVFFHALWFEYKRCNKLTQKIKYCLLGISGWTIGILFSTGSRSSILSFAIVAVISSYIFIIRKYPVKSKCLFSIVVIILGIWVVSMNWLGIWENANREANILVNIPIFKQMNAFWKGMGYIESSGFYNDAYGYDTWPVDIYYLYIFLSTGVIGSIIIAFTLLYILYKLIRYKDCFIRNVILPSYIAILFDGFWQVNIFTYRYVATLFIGVLLLVSISLREKR